MMRYVYIITISLLLASCGPSAEEKKNIAAVTCSIMGETKNMDGAIRVEKLNDAREKIGGEPFLEGDDAILEAFEYELCEELVLNENYNEALQPFRVAAEEEWKRLDEIATVEAEREAEIARLEKILLDAIKNDDPDQMSKYKAWQEAMNKGWNAP
jgi:hypothetical protein